MNFYTLHPVMVALNNYVESNFTLRIPVRPHTGNVMALQTTDFDPITYMCHYSHLAMIANCCNIRSTLATALRPVSA